jgi:hypothetical protein
VIQAEAKRLPPFTAPLPVLYNEAEWRTTLLKATILQRAELENACDKKQQSSR